MRILTLNKNNPKYKIGCGNCGKVIAFDSLYVSNGPYAYHLSCFKKYYEVKIKIKQEEIASMQEDIDKLKSYTKEMICESLEMN